MGSLLRVGVAEKALVEFVTAPVPLVQWFLLSAWTRKEKGCS